MKKDEVHNVVVHNVVNLKSAMLLRSLPPPKKKRMYYEKRKFRIVWSVEEDRVSLYKIGCTSAKSSSMLGFLHSVCTIFV